MKSYYRIMLGRKSVYAEECFAGGFIGASWLPDTDLTNHLPDDRREFNKTYIPKYLEQNPDKKKVSAGLACGMLYTIAKALSGGDVVLCPDGKGQYHIGQIVSDYVYHPGHPLPHRRAVSWYASSVGRDELSEPLRNSTGAIGTVSDISQYAAEIESFISGVACNSVLATAEGVEDPSSFALEKHLEDFLVKNWAHTELGKAYDIYSEEGEMVGQQYPSDTGPIDILAVSKDKKELLVVELKRGRASDVVVGQILRYMGFVQEELLEAGQKVKGLIIAHEDDVKIRRALSVAPHIDFSTYKIDFKLEHKKR